MERRDENSKENEKDNANKDYFFMKLELERN